MGNERRTGKEPRTGANGCGLAGSKSLLGPEGLAALYPDHGAYVSRVVRRAQELVQQGWLLEQDAQTSGNEAAASQVPFEAAIP